MPTVKVSPHLEPSDLSHDIALSHDGNSIGLMFVRGQPSVLQHIPLTDPVRQFSETQNDWTGGRGRRYSREDPTAFWDSKDAWTMTGGKIFQAPQWYLGSNIRTSIGSYNTGSVSWRACYGDERYLADTFLVSASTAMTARRVLVKLRQVGMPNAFRIAIYSSTGTPAPDAALDTSDAFTATSGDFVSRDKEIYINLALSAGTRYWVVCYGSANDNESNHWEIGTNASGTGGRVSSDATTWTIGSPAFSIYYRVTPIEVEQRLLYFMYDKALYCVTQKDNINSAPELYINGDRGIATGGTSTTLEDTASGVSTWTANEWAGYYVMIVSGTGVGQVRQITSNTTTALTVSPAWRRTPTTASRYVIYGGPKWTQLTGHGMTRCPSGRPAAARGVVYFPLGIATDVIRMQEDTTKANNHDWQGTATAYRYDFLETHTMPNVGVRIFVVKSSTCSAAYVTPPEWATASPVAPSPVKGGVIGSSDTRVTSVKSTGDKIYFGKEDGLWWLDETTPKQFTLSIKDVPEYDNLTAICAQGDTVYFGYGNSFGYLTGTQHKDLLNYRAGYEGLAADRAGTISSVLTVLGWVLFAIDGGDDNYSSIYAWNGIGIHEVWRSWKTGCRVRDMFYFPCYEARGQLWFDCNGEAAYIEFPFKRSNPLLDSGMSYRPEWSIVTGIMDIEKENLYKAFKTIRVTSENLSANARWIDVDYQADNDVDTENWMNAGRITQSPYQEIVFARGTVKKIRFRFRGMSTSETTPAVMTSYDILGEVAEPPRFQWLGTFQVGQEQETYDGQNDFKPDEIYAWLKEAHDKMIVCELRAARAIDDKKKVTVSLPADVADVVEKGKWDGRISVQIREV